MSRPLILKCAKKRLWLVLEGSRGYRPIAPSVLRLRLKELGLAWTFKGLKSDLRPGQILAKYGATVSRSEYEAAELAGRS